MTDNDHQVSDYDRQLGNLDGLTDVLQTRPTTIRVLTPLVGVAETFIVQTYRHRELGDTIFLEHVGPGGTDRHALPAKVANTIARQRDQLTTKSRRKAGRERAAADKAAGVVPGFMRPGAKKAGPRKKKAKRAKK